ncbi:Ig-like domain-containing protein [Cohnella thermotolerans]|uniref:Ig-like domain-containing protein n=1 Tax=Cohnella thermotolerans TaxID=329858 RepID=UPI00047E3602|nr:Ig-like domain-containing protein [Cohnella thermotolerans]
MKKSLSVLVASALVFGSFGSLAAAADTDLTTAQKYQQLVDSKILKGTTDGLPHLEDNLTRAQFATIAIAVAGLSEDTSSTPAFADVKAGQWWTGAIQAAYNAGLVNGVGGGLFSPKANVTVQEIIKVAVGIAKLKPVEGAVVEGAAAWAGPYIKAAQDAGLPIPTNYTAPATRGQTIDLAYAVYQSLQVKPLTDVKATVNADDTITVTGKTAGGVDGVKVAIGTGEAAAATLNSDGTFTYTTSKQSVGDYKLTVTAYKGDTVVTSAEVSASIDGFAVSKVTVLNSKQIAIEFNKAVQSGVATGGAEYKIGTDDSYYTLAGNIKPYDADVSSDGKTVTLSFDEDKTKSLLDTYVQVQVSSDLKSASGKSLSSYKQAVYFSDTTAPSVTAVNYKGNKYVEVKFSEPLSEVGTVSINGVEISDNAQDTSDKREISYQTNKDVNPSDKDITSIRIYNLDLDTSYALDIVGITDLNDNAADYSTTLKVPNDTTAPSVSSVTVKGTYVYVKYSEDVVKNEDGNHAAYSVTVGGGKPKPVDEVSYDDSDGVYTAKLDLTSFLDDSSYKTVTLTIDKGSYSDYADNLGAKVTKTLKLTDDQDAPEYSSVSYSGNDIIVKFNEDVALDQIPDSLSVTYTNTDGVVSTKSVAYDASGASGYEVVAGYDVNNDGDTSDEGEAQYIVITVHDSNLLATSSKLKAGKYKVTIPANFVHDLGPSQLNLESAVYPTITVTSSSDSGTVVLEGAYQLLEGNAGAIEDAIAAANAAGASITRTDYGDEYGNNKLIFIFNSEIPTSQLKAENFLLNGVQLPSGTTFDLVDSRYVVVATLPEGTIKTNGSRTLKVANLVDASGNTLSSDSDKVSTKSTFVENVAPVAKSAEFYSDTQIAVTFSESLDTATDSGISVYVNGNKVNIRNVEVDPTNSKVVLIDVVNSISASASVYVKLSGADIKDVNGNSAKDVAKLTVQ